MADIQAQIPVTMCFTKATLAAGTTSTLLTTGTTTYAVKGKFYTKTALSNVATPTTDFATGAAFLPIPVSYGSVFNIGFDKSGNVKAIQGTIVPLDGIANSAKFYPNGPQFGGLGPAGSGSTNNDFCPIGYVVIQNGTTGSAWTFGSSNWTATDITATFVDIATLPDRPQIS